MAANSTSLPVYAIADELLKTIENHQIVVVEGATGCGKTTQIPRILHKAHPDWRIAVTQPRRIAAVSVAARIAFEEGAELGGEVGYRIRFDDKSSSSSKILIMTDGILLNEARLDSELSAYDLIMVDEAHERSLNIDITLGLLYQICLRRPDVRVIISSATLNPRQFQTFFDKIAPEVPLLTIDSRPFPVEIIYRPAEDLPYEDLLEAIEYEALALHAKHEPGHILVFLPGMDAIRRLDHLLASDYPYDDLKVLPLYSRLSREDQEAVFADYGRRKLILATNIAETSVTIPDVRYVLDSGYAKVPWFSPKTGVTTLREEFISRSSAVQRAGRAGRTAPGVAIRFYSEETLDNQPELTVEEITRLELSEVLLRLIILGHKEVEEFPLPTPLPLPQIKAAIKQLMMLGAIDEDRNLTPVGRQMAAFPLSPGQARMVIAAADYYPDVTDDVLVIAAFFSVNSPYIFNENDDTAKRSQKYFSHPLGDAIMLLRLFRAWQKHSNKESFCRKNSLDIEVMRFVDSAYEQLKEIAAKEVIKVAAGGDYTKVVKAVAYGLSDKIIARRDGNTFESALGTLVSIHPSSIMAGSDFTFGVAQEFIRYAKTFAFKVSRLEAEWISEISPPAAAHFGLKGAKREKNRQKPPEECELGPYILPIENFQGKPTVNITLEQVAKLKKQKEIDLSHKMRHVRGRVILDSLHSFAPLPLPKLLGQIKTAPYPQKVPESCHHLDELMESDRHLYQIGATLPKLLSPTLNGRTAGWLALITNGQGGYWLSQCAYYRDALTATKVSLETLFDELPAGDELAEKITAFLDKNDL